MDNVANEALRVAIGPFLAGTETFTANTAAREYGTTPFRIGRAQTNWAADGRVDQVRIYNVALSNNQIADLYNETEGPALRFPVGMAKGTQINLLGVSPTPDGHLTTGSVAGLQRILDSARVKGARVTVRVTGGNANFIKAGTAADFDIAKWRLAFDDVKDMPQSLTEYVADGTLIGHYAIDEPFSDFDNMTSGLLEQICAYQKSFADWQDVPCIVREKNIRLYEHSDADGYQSVDAGVATIVDHAYVQDYNNDMQAYFQDNLTKGDSVGLGLLYSFNLLNGGRETTWPNCARPDDQDDCAMTASEVREVADAIAALGNDQGCGVIGYEINASAGPARDYFFSQGIYSNNGIQSALGYLNTTVGGLQPGSCGP